jgi:hypothetical protein
VCGISRTHRGHRNEFTLEYKKARSYCFQNAFFEPEEKESIYLGEPEQVMRYVEIALGNNMDEFEVPDTPRGLVLTDVRGRGAFQ